MNLEMSDAARDLLERERWVIADLRALLGRLDADESHIQELKTALEDLEGLFMLVVCGEYNAGKSTFLNALLGEKIMPQGVTPTTDRVTIVSYGETDKEELERGFIMRRETPSELLRALALVDTPGTNAVIQEHQELTEKFVPRADLVLFVTSSDRPFSETEKSFLELISSWGKKIVLIVNKIDIFDDPDELQSVLDFVQEHARKTLGVTPQVFGLKAKQALQAKLDGDQHSLKDSGLLEVERFVEASLAGNQRIQLKFKSPLGVAQHVADTYKNVLAERLSLLEGDKRTLGEVDRQIVQFEKDMKREFDAYIAKVKTVLLEVERRGEVFFDDVVRIGRVMDLVQGNKIRAEFEKQVIRGADNDVERAVNEMVDWFIERNLQLWEDVMAFINSRRQAAQDRVIGEVGGRFQYNRDELIRMLSRTANDVMEQYDESRESARLADSLRSGVLQTGLIQAGGLGLGAALVAFLSGVMFDLSGILMGITVAGLGFLVLPRRRRLAKQELHTQMQTLRDDLESNLSSHFVDELDRSTSKLNASIGSYTRFVRSELGRLESLQNELADTEQDLRKLEVDIEKLMVEAPEAAVE
ncbi:MAG: dynamin family protein [Deinococcota bacterium]